MKRLLIIVVLSIWPLGGCTNSANSNAPASTAAHEAGWLLKHDSAAKNDLFGCQVCHGVSFTGNSPVPSCFQCHLSGPPFFVHPPSPEPALDWSHPVNHGSLAKADIKACQGCHGRLGGPGSNSPFETALGGLEKGCNSITGCHNNNDLINAFSNGHNNRAAHPAYDPNGLNKQDRMHWYGENIAYRTANGAPLKNYLINHHNAGNMSTACALCHGAKLKGHAEGGVGPACTDCHVLDPIAYPSRCVSCHGPLPGLQQTGPPLKPSQLAALAGRTDFQVTPAFQTFTNQMTARMKRDPSYIVINPATPLSALYYAPAGFVSFTSAVNLSNRSSHLHHDTLPCKDRLDNSTCSACHNDKPNIERHHDLMLSAGLGCTNCHKITLSNGVFSLGNFADCRDCHLENFCK